MLTALAHAALLSGLVCRKSASCPALQLGTLRWPAYSPGASPLAVISPLLLAAGSARALGPVGGVGAATDGVKLSAPAESLPTKATLLADALLERPTKNTTMAVTKRMPARMSRSVRDFHHGVFVSRSRSGIGGRTGGDIVG